MCVLFNAHQATVSHHRVPYRDVAKLVKFAKDQDLISNIYELVLLILLFSYSLILC